ncbi:MAG: hypothetical protein O2955_03155 [Planctomycetota bacterium]|nr:hypothetical protein [Planctomycetota bacterium]MDA1211486.1 hypothetical protein [Planctomycetota bacterium]
MTKKTIIVAGIVFVLLSWVAIDALVNSQVRRFKMLLTEDNSRNKVTQSVGKPDKIIAAGSELSAWGRYEKANVRYETWVYFVFPKNRNRLLLTFDGDKLLGMDHQKN